MSGISYVTSSSAIADVIAERARQVKVEGFTHEHDDQYASAQLVEAAVAYACADNETARIPEFWPWHWQFWKPRSRRRNLVRSAALIIAEIERMDRAASAEAGEGGS